MLLERDTELALVGAALRAAEDGESSVVLIRGPLGIGRSALLHQLPALVTGEEVRVLRASAATMEQDFAFGVVRQLFDSLLAGARHRIREDWTRERGGLVRLVFADDAVCGPGGYHAAAPEAVLHALRSLLAEVSADSRLLLLVDDLQWADEPSLRWLAYLAKRLHGLRAVLVCTLRDGDPRARHPLVREVADAATRLLRPRPLSPAGAAAMVLDQFGEPGEEEFARACHQTSAGNPLFLRSILLGVAVAGGRPTADRAEQARSMRPAQLRDRLVCCLRAQPRPVRDLAAAMAAFDGAGEQELIARLAGLDTIGFAGALRTLHQLGLLAGEQEPRFVHRVVRDAVESSMTVAERERLHDAAAALLYGYGCPAEQVAAQLMAVTTSRQPWAVVVLRSAADTALRRGAPDTAARYLRRALMDSSAQGEDRARLLIDLATAERGFDPAACERHVAQAVPLLTTATDRAAAALRIAPTVLGVAPPSVVELLRDVAGELGAPDALEGGAREAALRLEARLRHCGHEDPAELTAATERLRGLGEDPPLRSAAERELLVVLLNAATLTCQLTAAEVAELGNRILEREPATAAHVHSALPLVAITLVAADSVRQIGSWLSVEQRTRRRDATLGDALVDAERALLLTARGRLAQARERAEQAMRLAAADGHEVGALATMVLGAVALEVRDPALSERVLRGGHRRGDTLALAVLLRTVDAALEAQRGHWTSALDTLLACGRQLEASGWRNPALFPWRPWAVSLYHRLGDARSALALAEEEHAGAVAWGAPAALGRALRLRGKLHSGRRGVDLLREAVDTLRGSANELELARALVLLGLRLGDGAEARAALREGGTLAAACGAPWLVERARCGSGAAAGSQVPLTRTERRVTALAGRGLTNQEIAGELGVTSRAVEKHLTNAYRKLGVSGRRELVAALSTLELAGTS